MAKRKGDVMQLTDLIKLKNILDDLLNDDFLSEYKDEEAIVACLDRRDSEPFDSEWIRVDKIVSERVLHGAERESIEALAGKYRKLFFDKVIRVTGSSDLAAYVSEDIELILAAIGASVSEEFVFLMLDSYKKNNVPVDIVIE